MVGRFSILSCETFARQNGASREQENAKVLNRLQLLSGDFIMSSFSFFIIYTRPLILVGS